MPTPLPPGRRKYATEMTLVISTADAFVARAQELSKIERPVEPPCHLYIVSSRPRMSIHPDTVRLSDNELSAVLKLQHGGEFDEHPISSPHSLGSNLTWESEWPYEEFRVTNVDGDSVFSGPVAILSIFRMAGWPHEAAYMDVLYIGQAYGKQGERTAWDRLESHGTVQRILAECPSDRQVWLSLVTVFDVQLFTEIVPPTGAELASDEEDRKHIETVWGRVHSDGFADKEAVALAEAGLIRLFQPRYNDRLKYNFPARKQVPLETARELDLHGLVVELQSEESGMLYRSEVRRAEWVHFAGFVIHTDEDRALTLNLASLESVYPTRAVPPPGEAPPLSGTDIRSEEG